MKRTLAFHLVIGLTLVIARAQVPAILSLSPDGTIVWTNVSTNVVAVVEQSSPATSGEWVTVYAELPTSTASSVQLAAANDQGWFRVVNAANSNAPANMVLIPGGSNSGTNPLGLVDGEPETHDPCMYPATYSLSVESFYMDCYEVTKALWDEVFNWAVTNGYTFDHAGSGKAADHPVHSVNWFDCVKWCNARGEMENRTPAYYSEPNMVYRTGLSIVPEELIRWDTGYRLPTLAEWEHAARGGAANQRFPWGGTISHAQANYEAGIADYDLSSGSGFHPSYEVGEEPYTSPVGAFTANAYGLYDMAGNVYEWCADWHPCYVGLYRGFRGGSWSSNAKYCGVGFPSALDERRSGKWYGFRTVLPPGQ